VIEKFRIWCEEPIMTTQPAGESCSRNLAIALTRQA
jgi:hypothetical protein